MFQRILVVLNDDTSRHCVFNTALRFAQTDPSQLCIVDLTEDQDLRKDYARSLEATATLFNLNLETIAPLEKTAQALLEVAEHWCADLIIMGNAIHPDLTSRLPCTVMIVQQADNHTISMTMLLKPQTLDLAARDRLERLLELTPSS